jgi:peptidoglycan/xylan/chitin deacetylase (PgdA/CDA1 family)
LKVPILVYHRVTDEPLPGLEEYAVRPAAFRRQMRVLRLGGWSTVGPDDLLAARREQRPLPRRPVMLTFDDAYAELERDALPVLRANGQTAAIYACSSLLGAAADLLRRDDRHEEAQLMDGAALRRAQALGFTVGSHTATHPRLVELGDDELREELTGSREALSGLLGEDVRHLAYPFGAHDERVREAAGEAGYASAVTTDRGTASDEGPPLCLPRIYVSWGEGASRLALRLLRAARG